LDPPENTVNQKLAEKYSYYSKSVLMRDTVCVPNYDYDLLYC